MDFQFILPLKNSDLLETSGDNFYVKSVYNSKQIPEQLNACRHEVHKGDPFYIFDHFDTYFAIIENSENNANSLQNLMRAFNLLYLTVDKLGNRLAPLLGCSEAIPMEERKAFLNLTKMTMFLMVNTVKKIDSVVKNLYEQQQQNAQGARRKGGAVNKNIDALQQYPDWDVKRAKFLIQLFNVMQFPLERLWNPPIVEENFVNLLCDICYRTMDLSLSRNDSNKVGDTIFQVIGTAIKRYNHAMIFPVRILQILRNIEQAAPIVASGLFLLHEEYNITSVFSVLCKDIVETLTVDSNDTVVSKNFSNFLIEMASIAPKLMIPHISTLSDELLNCESHVLRNCILQIMGDAIVGELTAEGLSDELREARDEFLDNLLLHINDVSAHVRAKVLQIWHHLKEEDAVPLSYQRKVLVEAVDRLDDKTSSVRKFAVQLIKAFLERNPYSGNLTLEELMKKHEEEAKKMDEMGDLITEAKKKSEELAEKWTLIAPEILPFLAQSLQEATALDMQTQDSLEDLVERINSMILEGKYKEAVTLVRKADYAAGNAELSGTLAFDEQCHYYLALLKSYMDLASGCKAMNDEIETQARTLKFLQESVLFSKAISKAMPKLQDMLYSKTTSDVFEAVDLFTTAYMFGIKGTEQGMKQLLYLVWSTDKEKRDTISNAYKKVLFTTDLRDRAHAIKVAQNLSNFLKDLDLGHYTSLESLIKEWVSTDDIDALIIQVLFERLTLKLEGTTEEEARLSLQLLIMASNALPTIAASNLNVIETIAFSDRALKDPRLYTSCLEFLLTTIDANLNSKFYKRFNADHHLVQKVIDHFGKLLFHPRCPDFDRLAMRTFEFFYHMCQAPDMICTQFIINTLKKFKNFAVKIIEISASQQQANHESPFSQELPESQPVTSSQLIAGEGKQLRMPAFLLTRFIFCVGYITLKELIFLDLDVYNNMKYRQELTEANEKNKNKTNKKKRRTNLNMSATESLKRLSGTAAEPQQEPDEDLVGATAEDNIAELINHICEEVLLQDEKGILKAIVPFIVEICKYPSKYKDPVLQQAATLTLMRFMCVSSQFCGTHMPFLMNILQYTKNIKIKCNIVIGLGDLTFRFPNIIEPWAGHLYATLHEDDTELRLTVVKMLSHLVLHEMLRVKGQIADLALCTVDANEEIRNITLQFFKEIANKSNILYNVLPEIISKLSEPGLNLEEEKYRTIMRHILSLIQKDRQVETLVEKLCLRFPQTFEERQWRDIAYCLSLLTYNERCIKKLIDNVSCYRDKVQIDEVYQSFKLIISNTNKLAKPELKTICTELETKIEECLKVKGPNDENVETNPEGENTENSDTATTTSTQPKPPTRGKQNQKSSGRRRPGSSNRNKQKTRGKSSDDSDDSDDSSEDERFSRRNKSKKGGRKKKSSSSDDSDDSDDNNSKNKSNRTGKKRNDKVFEEDSDSSDDEQTTRKNSKQTSRRRR